MKRILIYGFGVYRDFKANVTETIIRRLPRRNGLKKIIFPVRFHRRQFIDAVRMLEPEIVLGLGQCSRGRRLRIERQAVNKRRNHRREKATPIIPGGPRRLYTNLELKLGSAARFSHNAGDYVCNFSMYVVLAELKRRRLPIPYGFIHIPHDYDSKKAMRVLLEAVDRIETASLRRQLP